MFAVSSDLTGVALAKANRVPLPDQQAALALLLELAVQRGSLRHLLEAILLLLNLWSSAHHDCDNRFSSNLTSAPLLPLLHRFHDVPTSKKGLETRSDEVCVTLILHNIHSLTLFL